MLAVHRHDLRTAAVRLVHHQFPGADQRFLVGQGDTLFLSDGGQRGLQSHHANHGGDYRFRLRDHGGVHQSICTGQHLYRRVLQANCQFLCSCFLRHHRQAGTELPALCLHSLHVGIGGQCRHLQAQLLRYIQSLTADGAGGAQY